MGKIMEGVESKEDIKIEDSSGLSSNETLLVTNLKHKDTSTQPKRVIVRFYE
jgi:hypothetical protein